MRTSVHGAVGEKNDVNIVPATGRALGCLRVTVRAGHPHGAARATGGHAQQRKQVRPPLSVADDHQSGERAPQRYRIGAAGKISGRFEIRGVYEVESFSDRSIVSGKRVHCAPVSPAVARGIIAGCGELIDGLDRILGLQA